MNPAEEKTAPTRAPRSGLQLMALVLVVMALLAIYANVQKARRADIETVTIIPAPSPVPSPAATAP
ncbi:MAG: hypothetical protein ACR2HH_02520 [Chthoniobacterales bacterium]